MTPILTPKVHFLKSESDERIFAGIRIGNQVPTHRAEWHIARTIPAVKAVGHLLVLPDYRRRSARARSIARINPPSVSA